MTIGATGAGFAGLTASVRVTIPNVAPTASASHVFPQFADGQAADGNYYRTTLLITNPTTTTANCTLLLHGLTINGRSAFSYTNISPGSWTIDASLGTMLPLKSGYATLGCSTTVEAELLYSLYAPNGAKLSETTVFSSPPAETLQFLADTKDGATFGVAIANNSDEARTVKITAKGAGLGDLSKSLRFGPRSSYSAFLNELLPTLPQGYSDQVEVSSDAGVVSAIGIRYTNAVFTTIPSVLWSRFGKTAGKYHVFPQFADGVAVDGGAIRTTLMLLNPDDRSGSCTFRIYGLTVNGSSTLALNDIRSGEGRIVTSPLSSEQPMKAGYASLDCSMNVEAQLLYSSYDPNGIKLSEATVFSSRPAPSIEILADHRGGGQLGLAIANDSDRRTTYTITAFDDTGSSVGSRSLEVLPRANHAAFLNELIPSLPANYNGGVVVSSDDGSAAVIGLHYTGNVFTTIPQAPLVTGVSPNAPSASERIVPVRIGSDVDATTRASLVISSVAGEASGSGIPILAFGDGSGETIVVATDVNENIMLIGLGTAGGVDLSAQSTAISLVRVALGAFSPPDVSVAALQQRILSARSFANLHSLVASKVRSHLSPVESSDVIQMTFQVSSEVLQALGGSTAAALLPSDSFALDISENVIPPLPYYFIRNVLLAEHNLWLEDVTPPGPAVLLTNATRVQWRATSRDVQGNEIWSDFLPWWKFDFWSIIPGGNFLNLYEPRPQVTLPGNNSEFTVTIEQTAATRKFNLTQLVTKLAAFFLQNYLAVSNYEKCAANVADLYVLQNLGDLLQQQPGDQARQAFRKKLLEDTTRLSGEFWRELLVGCGLDPAKVAAKTPSRMLKSLMAIWTALELSKTAVDVYFGGNVFYYFDYSKTVRVCKVEGVVKTCRGEVASVEISPENPVVNMGSSIPLTLTGKDKNGGSARLPEGATIQWSSSNSSIATVDQNGTVRGVAVGRADITVAVRAIGPTGQSMWVDIATVTVNDRVVSLVITPASPSMFVGSTIQLSLTARDAGGAIVPLPSVATVQWSSDNLPIATVNQSGLVVGVAQGIGRIRATVPAYGLSAEATVTVQPNVVLKLPPTAGPPVYVPPYIPRTPPPVLGPGTPPSGNVCNGDAPIPPGYVCPAN
jgi:hypothetical protein